MKTVHWFYAGCAALVVVIYWTTNTWPVSFLICQDQDWWRNWIGALSGWVAAAGALIAAVLTLPHLKRQADEAKRQSDFALGESLPTFDVYSDDFNHVHFRIVNWNRRTFLLDRVTFVDLSSVTVSAVSLSDRGKVSLRNFNINGNYEPEFNNAIRIDGFEDRSKPPISCTIEARIFRVEGMGITTATFFVKGRLLGERHEEITLQSTADVRPFWHFSEN